MFARKLKECGYATSPTYAEKLIGLMRQYDLYKYNVSSSGVKSGILNTIKNSAGFKAVENVALQAGVSTIATNMINGAKAQIGKKYSEMVCNQLVESAMKWAGLTPPTTGSVYRHFNHNKMHLILNDPNNGINPNDPKLKPGMILFSHPFTEAEALHYNNGKNGPRKAGDPGHMGIYAGNGLWWNSTSSKNTTDYSSGTGVNVTDSNKGFGVALTKPFTKGTYKLFAAGYYEGMYDAAEVKNLADAPSKEYNGQGESQIKLTKDELDRLLAEGISTAIASGDTSKLIESAKLLLSAQSQSGAPNMSSEIVKYLKEIVLRMRGKPATVAKPVRAPMG
jgi:cell wall-associated NlpC family hydrolase